MFVLIFKCVIVSISKYNMTCVKHILLPYFRLPSEHVNMSPVLLVLCHIFALTFTEGARILAVFPIASISHQVVFRPFTQELAKRGHEVTVITTDPEFPKGETPSNLTEIDVHDITYNIKKEIFMLESKRNIDDEVDITKIALKAITLYVEAQLQHEDVKKIINDKSKQFDLLILEACARPALIYSHIYKVPVILISSFYTLFDNYDILGVPTHPVLYPAAIQKKLYNLTLWEKISKIYLHHTLKRIYHGHKMENEMIRKYLGANAPSIAELYNNVDMLFLNIHPMFEGIRPVPPNVIHVGGLHKPPQKELPEDLKSYLDSSENGVIYLSFGTNVGVLPADRVEVFLKTLSHMPYDVLWKWNEDELPGRTENIRISKWFPQADLLRHPKIKLFITQGGLQSTDEAITAGVPLVGVPMSADQWYNVEKYRYFGIGVGLDLETLTVETLTNAVKTVISDNSYRHNIAKLRSVMRDEVQSPLERAVWWTEYVLRHGGARHLRDPAANISWYQYLELELVAVVLGTVVIIIMTSILILQFLYKKVIKYYINSLKIKRS